MVGVVESGVVGARGVVSGCLGQDYVGGRIGEFGEVLALVV
mgnify:CR=1 FL=1